MTVSQSEFERIYKAQLCAMQNAAIAQLPATFGAGAAMSQLHSGGNGLGSENPYSGPAAVARTVKPIEPYPKPSNIATSFELNQDLLLLL